MTDPAVIPTAQDYREVAEELRVAMARPQGVAMDHPDELLRLLTCAAGLQAELDTSDTLIEMYKSVLLAVPECIAHGECVPHAIEWIEQAKAREARLLAEVTTLQAEHARLTQENVRLETCINDAKRELYGVLDLDGERTLLELVALLIERRSHAEAPEQDLYVANTELERQLAEARAQVERTVQIGINRLRERDAAIERAETAEQERDALKRWQVEANRRQASDWQRIEAVGRGLAEAQALYHAQAEDLRETEDRAIAMEDRAKAAERQIVELCAELTRQLAEAQQEIKHRRENQQELRAVGLATERQLAEMQQERDALRRVQQCYINNDTRSGHEWNLAERVETTEHQLAELTAVVTANAAVGEYSPEQVLVLARTAREDSDLLDDVRDQLETAERQLEDVRALCAVIQPWVMSGDVLFLLSDPIAAKRALDARGTPLSGEVLLPPQLPTGAVHAEPATREPDLLAYMHATTTKQRDVAFLRTYAERIRNGTELTWEIPNTRAATITDIANRLERLPEPEQAEASRGDAPAPSTGWQPIATAPKGKIVLMFAVTDRHEDGRVANWKMATGNFGFGDYSERLTWDGDIIDKPYQHRPTHWFALPAPPATKGDAE